MLYGELPTAKLDDGSELKGVLIRIPNPPKTAVLGLPTNEQMMTRMDSQKSVRRNLGRRKSTTDGIPATKADLTMFNAIRVDTNGAEFDEFEASAAVGKLTYVEVIECQRVGEHFEIQLKTPFGVTVHTVGLPTQKAIQIYRRSVVTSIDLPHGQEELRYRIQPACDLYDSVAVSVTGYVTGFTVPPHHKSSIVIELVNSIDDMDPVIDPNF